MRALTLLAIAGIATLGLPTTVAATASAVPPDLVDPESENDWWFNVWVHYYYGSGCVGFSARDGLCGGRGDSGAANGLRAGVAVFGISACVNELDASTNCGHEIVQDLLKWQS